MINPALLKCSCIFLCISIALSIAEWRICVSTQWRNSNSLDDIVMRITITCQVAALVVLVLGILIR